MHLAYLAYALASLGFSIMHTISVNVCKVMFSLCFSDGPLAPPPAGPNPPSRLVPPNLAANANDFAGLSASAAIPRAGLANQPRQPAANAQPAMTAVCWTEITSILV